LEIEIVTRIMLSGFPGQAGINPGRFYLIILIFWIPAAPGTSDLQVIHRGSLPE
jgi:hypothetical protein